jgi:hypothetical protein
MFRPQRTVESVARELIDGLDEGTIELFPDAELSLEDFRSQLAEAIKGSRRRETIFFTVCLILGAMSMAISLVAVLFGGREPASAPDHRTGIFVTAICLLAAGLAGFVVGLMKARVTTTRLKTYASVLKMADHVTAEHLASQLARKLSRARQPVH